MLTNIPPKERETIITFGPEGKTANVYTSDPTMEKKLIKLGCELSGSEYGVEAEVPKTWVLNRDKCS